MSYPHPIPCRSSPAPTSPGAANGRGAPRGFTLLEVMIALAILSMALVAIAGINSGAMDQHSYAKRLTIATMLARSKMNDLESKLQAEGLPSDDHTEEGSFDSEGYAEYKWQAEIIRPKTEDISTQNLIASTGMGLEGLLGGAGGGAVQTALGGAAKAGGGGPTSGGLGGMLGGLIQGQLQRMLDDLGKTVREVRLTVSWKQGKQTDQFTVVTHVVSLGQGTDQAASAVAPQGLNPSQLLSPNAQQPGNNGIGPQKPPPFGGPSR